MRCICCGPAICPSPAGETCLAWRRAVELPVSIKALGRVLPAFEPGQIGTWLDAGKGVPVTRPAMVLEAVRQAYDLARRVTHLKAIAPKLRADRSDPELDRELADLPPELRWREWMRRIEAVLFASAPPVPCDDLARVVGQSASVDLLVEDLAADLEGRAFEIAQIAGGWIFRKRLGGPLRGAA